MEFVNKITDVPHHKKAVSQFDYNTLAYKTLVSTQYPMSTFTSSSDIHKSISSFNKYLTNTRTPESSYKYN